MISGMSFNDELPYLRRKFREDVTDRSTGLGLEALKADCRHDGGMDAPARRPGIRGA